MPTAHTVVIKKRALRLKFRNCIGAFQVDNARVNRDAATRTEVGLVESDIMGGTTIRRLIGHADFTASVQRFVIQTAE